MRKRANGEGTIYRRKDGRWSGQVTTGHTPEGKQVRKTIYGDTQAEVRKQMESLRSRPIQPEASLFAEMTGAWLGVIAQKVSGTTYDQYEMLLQEPIEHLGRLPAARVTAAKLGAFYEALREKGRSTDWRRKVAVKVRQCCKWALEEGILTVDPAARCPLPRHEKVKVESFSLEEMRLLLAAAAGKREHPLLLTALDSGARQGELFALTWPDLDLERGDMSISKTLEYRHGQLRVKEPKTKASRRRIPLTPPTIQVLQDLRSRAKLDQPVFPAPRGGYWSRGNFRKRVWLPLLKRANLPHRGFHSLRHTCATLLLTQNCHPKIVQERLGHSSIVITLDIYSHVLPTMQSAAVAILGSILGG